MPSGPLVKNSLQASDLPGIGPVDATLSELSVAAEPTGLLSVQGVFNRARALKSLLRMKPFDTSTQEGRSRERYRRAALTTFTSLVARGVSVLTTVITVRLTVHYLGAERYGLWVTVTSVVAFLIFADLGIGSGLLNAISEAHGKDDHGVVHSYVSSAFFVLMGVALTILIAFWATYRFVPWPRVFNVTSDVATREAGPAMAAFVLCFVLNVPLGIVSRVQMGYQEGFAINLWAIGGSFLSLGGILAAIHFQCGLPWFVLAVSGGPVVAAMGNWGYEFGRSRPWAFPTWSGWDPGAARFVLSTGTLFLIIQVATVFSVTIDNWVIAQVLGAEAVTQYAVPMRLFMLVGGISLIFVTPLWPAYGEAMARGDVKWVRSTVYRSLGYSLVIFVPAALGLAAFGKLLVRLWVGAQVQPTHNLLFGMACWTIASVLVNAMVTFLSGINALKFQAGVWVLLAIANLVLKVVMGRAFGLSGVIWGGVLAYFLGVALLAAHSHRLLTRTGAVSEG
jgi:O-antigen/teichoic acid export membrane protein